MRRYRTVNPNKTVPNKSFIKSKWLYYALQYISPSFLGITVLYHIKDILCSRGILLNINIGWLGWLPCVNNRWTDQGTGWWDLYMWYPYILSSNIRGIAYTSNYSYHTYYTYKYIPAVEEKMVDRMISPSIVAGLSCWSYLRYIFKPPADVVV